MTDAADDALQGIWNGLHAHWELKLGLVAIVVLLNLSFSRVLAQGRDAKNDNRADENSPKTVLLVTAHPDDEVMFFGPAILHLQTYSSIHLLCLSSGNADGLGKTRSAELKRAWVALGLDEEQLQVLEHKELQDGFDQEWKAAIVAKNVQDYVKKHDITHLLSFDSCGASWHPNHIDTAAGVRALTHDHVTALQQAHCNCHCCNYAQ